MILRFFHAKYVALHVQFNCTFWCDFGVMQKCIICRVIYTRI